MRPLVKGNPTTIAPPYIYYNGAGLATNVAFNGGYAVAIAFNGGAGGVRTMNFFLNALVTRKRGGYPYVLVGLTPAYQRVVDTAVRALLTPKYRKANPHLTAQLGPYCGYCEITMPGNHLDVEHRVPKENFPGLMTWWWNFLPACGRCDSQKGDDPSRATAIGWAGGGAPAEAAIEQAVEDEHFWPDLPDVNSNARYSFRRVQYRLRDVANAGGAGAYALFPMAWATAANTSFASFANYEVRANIRLGPVAPPTANVHVEITVDRHNYIGFAWAVAFNAQTANTLNFIGLDILGTERAGYRTLTWFRVLAAVANLRAYYAFLLTLGLTQVQLDTAFSFNWAQFLLGAQGFGNYSTIISLLQNIPYPAGLSNLNNYWNLAEVFIADSAPALALPFAVYPGTNIATVP